MFALTFSWAGVWGRFGIFRVRSVLIFGFSMAQALDNLSSFLINILVFGAIFHGWKNQGYMLFIAILIGIQWQKNQIKNKNDLLKTSQIFFIMTLN